MKRLDDKLIKWTPRITAILSFIVVLLAGTAVYILMEYQPKTACERNPVGKACQAIKIESDKARSVRSACVILKKAGYPCPVGDVRKRVEKKGNPDERSPRPGSVDSPGAGDGGSSGGGVEPSPGPSPAPPTPTPPTPPDPPPTPPDPPPTENPSGPLDGLTGPLNDTVDHAQDTVNGATDQVQETVCNLPVKLCP